MILDKINNVRDIKKLNLLEKEELAKEIRDLIIKTTSTNGGHLSSNLGVVELTIALYASLDLGKDKVIWDVGHQCYTHKILTGRKEDFSSLRKMNGISGFPRRNESIYDLFDTGHSSTSISLALGLARSNNILKNKGKVVAVIGDGALTSGLSLEALNDAGISKSNLVVILNDNKMSISKNTGGLSKFLTLLRTRKIYVKSNNKIKLLVLKLPFIGKYIYRLVTYIKKRIKSLLIRNIYFENIGFTYLGPVNGNSISDLEATFKSSSNLTGPVLIHVITKKGKGYSYSEKDADKYHAVGPFNIEKGILPSNDMTYSKVVGDVLVDLAKTDKRIVALTAAMEDGTGLDVFAKLYPDRFFDVEICEEHALTMASGMSKGGLIPFIPIYSTFLQRGYDEILHDICLNDAHVIILVDRAGNTGNDGTTHHGLYDISYLKTIPNLTILAPKDANELKNMIIFAKDYNHPVAIRYPKGKIININNSNNITLGKSEVLRKGDNITILAVGKMVEKALIVADKLEKDNISCEVINVRFIKPLDIKTIKDSFNKTKLLVTMEDNDYEYGFYEVICKYIDSNYIKPFGYKNIFLEHGNILELEKKYHLDIDSIYKEIVLFYNKNK